MRRVLRGLPRGNEGGRRGAVAGRLHRVARYRGQRSRTGRVGGLLREVPRTSGPGWLRAENLEQRSTHAGTGPRAVDPPGQKRDAARRARLVERPGAGAPRVPEAERLQGNGEWRLEQPQSRTG